MYLERLVPLSRGPWGGAWALVLFKSAAGNKTRIENHLLKPPERILFPVKTLTECPVNIISCYYNYYHQHLYFYNAN